jgi:hypothetical protein
MRHFISSTMVLGAIAAAAAGWSAAYAQNTPPGYNTPIPEGIMTPDSVETRLGTLTFADGMPSAETSRLVYDNLDFMRGVETFLNGIPAASVEAIRRGNVEMGVTRANQAIITENFMDANLLFLTGNTGTVYVSAFLDLERDGPTVMEIPPGMGPGTVNDAFFRFVVDMGGPGPDKGKGGKYLILPPGYEGDVPGGYFVATSPSYANWVILRGLMADGKPDAANKMFTEGLKIYPLSQAGNPPEMQFINGSKQVFNTIHANTYEFFEELNTVIDREPVGFLDPELRGLFASVGIIKGQPFAPDARMRAILEDAIKVGNATARAITFDTRDPNAFLFENSAWKTAFIGRDYRWLLDDGVGGRNLDARTLFFYQATVNTPAMALQIPGVGSNYAYAERDSNGDYLDGSKNYKLTIPANVPARNFWSVVVYDPQTRSELQTDQLYPSKNSARGGFDTNADGSVDLYFGPKAPAGKQANWTQTVPGKGWFTLWRVYGPLEPWFDRSWKPGEFELAE